MLKSVLLLIASATAIISTAAVSAPDKTETFVHDGITYKYSVEQTAKGRVLRGTAGPDAPFVLYVTDKKITGRVNGRDVSFKHSEVIDLRSATQIAGR
jgi:hypothetical protein